MKKILAMLLALMLVLSMLTVAVFAEPGDNSEELEGGDSVNVEDNNNAPAKEDNPKTGVALAVVPMMVAAAAAVVAKKH